MAGRAPLSIASQAHEAVEILVKIKLDSPPITWRRIETPGLMLRQAFGAPSQEYFDSLSWYWTHWPPPLRRYSQAL